MAAKKKKVEDLFRIEDRGAAADRKGKLFCGYIGGFEIGCVIASSQGAARKKLLGIARRLLS